MAISLTGFARKMGTDGKVLLARLEEYQCHRQGLYIRSGRVLAAEVPHAMLASVEESTLRLSRYTVENGVLMSVEAALSDEAPLDAPTLRP